MWTIFKHISGLEISEELCSSSFHIPILIYVTVITVLKRYLLLKENMTTATQITYINNESSEYKQLLKLFRGSLIGIPLDYLHGLQTPYVINLEVKLLRIEGKHYCLVFLSGGMDCYYILYKEHEDAKSFLLVDQLGFEVDDEEHYLSEEEIILKLLN